MVPDNQSIIQFLTYLSANTRMRMQEDLQAISELDRLSKLNTAAIIKSHRFSFRLKRHIALPDLSIYECPQQRIDH